MERGPKIPVGIMLLLLLAGCSRRATPPPTSVPPPRKPEPPVNLGTTTGSADRRDSRTGKRLYTIRWQTAAIQLGRAGIEEGTMNGVTGTIYQDETPTSTFSADIGFTKRATQTLRLERRVTVRSTQTKAVLTAAKLEWLPNVKRLRASGNVVVKDGKGTVTAPALDATPDLRKVATPEAFGLLR